MFGKYTVRDGPAGMRGERGEQIARSEWQVYRRPSDGSYDYVDPQTVIYRFSSTFLNKPDEFFVLLHSSRDKREHVFQGVTVPEENDSSQTTREFIYFYSDRPFEARP